MIHQGLRARDIITTPIWDRFFFLVASRYFSIGLMHVPVHLLTDKVIFFGWVDLIIHGWTFAAQPLKWFLSGEVAERQLAPMAGRVQRC
ncbi:hypothetical protein [Achromobacter pulmonis]|uniref:hypothetical protein n=1 Tax=Achromobacter pulmonis TaxID=1389932 RepID=UPI0015831784|nr:hypothetical protein [Achromobacter pulmonis]MCF7768097.1 hypothetical protein [Achromobacter pulmonis]